MQILDPLAIGDIALAARHVPYMLGVDEENLETPCFENLEHGDPEHACGLHCHTPDSAGLKPVGHFVKISGERFESSYWLNRTVWRDGHEHLFSSNINAGRVRVQYRQHADTARTFVFSLLTLRHVGSFCRNLRPEGTMRA